MKAYNPRKVERLFNKALKKAVKKEKEGFYKGAAIAYMQVTKYLSPNNLDERSLYLAKAACNYDESGDYLHAKKEYKAALSIAEKISLPDSLQISDIVNDLGAVTVNLGEYSEAEIFYSRALNIRQKKLGKKHPYTLQTLNNLASLYYCKGEFEKAISSYLSVLKEQKEVFFDQNLETALTLYNIGNTYHAQGSYELALDYAEQSLVIRKNILGSKHKQIAESLSVIGNTYASTKKLDLAEGYLNQALNMLEKLLGNEHPSLIVCLNALGQIYRVQSNFQKSLQSFQQAFSISKKALGNEHPETAMSLMNLGSIYMDHNEIGKAETCFQQALKIQEKKLDSDHPYIGLVLNNLGELSFVKGNNEKAEQYFFAARKILTKSLQPDHPYTKEIEKNYKNLQDKVAHLELEKLEKRAALHKSERLAYLGQMATMMAHNINNPIGIIRMIASGALGDLNDDLFDPATELKPLLEKVLLQTERLSEMMANFRKFSRGDRKQLSAVNLNELIEDIFQLLFDAPYQIDKIDMTKEFVKPVPMAHTNEFAIQEMLISLLSNAREAVKENSTKKISIKTWQQKGSVGFNIEDNGAGVTEEQQAKLFTPFLSSKSEGMGLGLYFCREIVKDLGGAIEYYSADLGGAGFKISLPIEEGSNHGI